jgi:hypothetical protein
MGGKVFQSKIIAPFFATALARRLGDSEERDDVDGTGKKKNSSSINTFDLRYFSMHVYGTNNMLESWRSWGKSGLISVRSTTYGCNNGCI